MRQAVTKENTSAHEAAVVLHREKPGLVTLAGSVASGKTTMLVRYAQWLLDQPHRRLVLIFEPGLGANSPFYDLHDGDADLDAKMALMEPRSVGTIQRAVEALHQQQPKDYEIPVLLFDDFGQWGLREKDQSQDYYHWMERIAHNLGFHVVVTLQTRATPTSTPLGVSYVEMAGRSWRGEIIRLPDTGL